MPENSISFDEFRDLLREVEINRWVFRGQRDESWGLESTLKRFCCNHGQEFSLGEFTTMLDRFISSISSHHTKDYSQLSLFQQIATAQHFGLPTPFLDWTFSPYIATYFAASELINTIPKDGRVRFKVWLLDISELDRLDEEGFKTQLESKTVDCAFIDIATCYFKRIAHQQGCFSFLNFKGCLNENKNLNNYLRSWVIEDDLLKIFQELKWMGISGVTLFDDIDYVAKDVIVNQLIQQRRSQHG